MSVGLVVYWTISTDVNEFKQRRRHFTRRYCLHYRSMPRYPNECEIVMLFIALADFAWNKYVMEERMKMTKQELKDEFKETEGNPVEGSYS